MPYTSLNGEVQMSQREKQAKYDQETLLRHMASNIREGRDVNASHQYGSTSTTDAKISKALVMIACFAFLFFVNPLLGLFAILSYGSIRFIKARKASKPRRDAERAERQDKAKGLTRDMFGGVVNDAEQEERNKLFGNVL